MTLGAMDEVCPPEHRREDTDRVPKTVLSESMSFEVLEAGR